MFALRLGLPVALMLLAGLLLGRLAGRGSGADELAH
jgi:hypothetical protein